MCLKFATGEISDSTHSILTGFITSVTSSPDVPFFPVIYRFARKYPEQKLLFTLCSLFHTFLKNMVWKKIILATIFTLLAASKQ